MDAVEKAKSGHPGTPMALAPVAYTLWSEYLRYDPSAPCWPNRDRYVVSCGHASMLLYAMIHLAGIQQVDALGRGTGTPAISLDDIRQFRQWGSRTPGHPEYRHTAGVEITTGPLGQGCGSSVGMAMAARWFASRYNRPGFPLFDYDTFVQCSDGDLMEGVACEAASLAGHLKLSNLCWLYDDNGITIEGSTDLAFSEDVATRFRGLGWNVLSVADANDRTALADALEQFKATADRPTLILVKSLIAWGAPNMQGTSKAHGSPLGADEIQLTKAAYGWPTDASFLVPKEVPDHFAATLGARGQQLRQAWDALFARYQQEHPALASELEAIWAGRLPEAWDSELPAYPADPKGLATRASSGKALVAAAKRVPWLLGGSADLAPSNVTLLPFDGTGHFSAKDYGGRNLHFGIREHAMAAVANGLALGGLKVYAGTFFVFSDYLRPAMRLAALMELPVVYVFTHDSIGVGEDGPTHQPIEHLAACRAIPNLVVIRPADANEASEAWRVALSQTRRPIALALSRQNLPTLCRTTHAPACNLAKGGYTLADCNKRPDVILIATGSEVALAVGAYEKLSSHGIAARVVAMPSFELFDEQPETYRDSILPPDVTARIGIEAGVRQGWDRYLGLRGLFIGLDSFGTSAPFAEIYRHHGLTVENIVAKANKLLDRA